MISAGRIWSCCWLERHARRERRNKQVHDDGVAGLDVERLRDPRKRRGHFQDRTGRSERATYVQRDGADLMLVEGEDDLARYVPSVE